jgi:hypothetical protein
VIFEIIYVFLFINGSQNFGPLAVLSCPAVHFLCMAILGGCWVPDRLPKRRLFELVATNQCSFL